MSYLVRLKSISLDGCAILLTGLAAAVTVAGAYEEGTRPLRKQSGPGTASYQQPDLYMRCLSADNCRQLEREGYLVIDDVLSKSEIQQVIMDVGTLDTFGGSPNDNASVRTDQVMFLGAESITDNSISGENGLKHARKLLRGLADAFATSEFKGFAPRQVSLNPEAVPNSKDRNNTHEYEDKWLGVPEHVQLSAYGGRGGEFYQPHRDACTDSISSMGLIGWLRSTYSRSRYITSILYLNDTAKKPWHASDGGYLRLYLGAPAGDDTGDACAEERIVEVEPRGGRLVLFSSRAVLHEVRPTYRPRLALTAWFTLN